MNNIKKITLSAMLFFLLSSCSSYKQFKYIAEEFEIPSQVFSADYNTTWQAILEVMKTFDLEIQDAESGIIKTRWIDNTLQLNFTESFGKRDAVKAAKFKVIVNASKGYRGSIEVTKVTVFKKQLVEQDFLQGWKNIYSDGIFEKTTLYRIKRIVDINKRIEKIEQLRSKELESEF